MTMQTTKRPTLTHEISASGTAARNTTAFRNSDISLYCADTAFYIKLGDSSVTATTTAGAGYDRYCAAGVYHDIRTGGATHVSVILASGTTTIYVNEWTNSAL